MILLSTSGVVGDERPTLIFDRAELRASDETISFPGCRPLPVNTSLNLPALEIAVMLLPGEHVRQLQLRIDSSSFLSASFETEPDIATSESDSYQSVSAEFKAFAPERRGLQLVESRPVGESTWVHLLICPVTIDSLSHLSFNHQLTVKVGERIIDAAEIRTWSNAGLSESPHPAPPSGGADYLIVTTEYLAKACSVLAAYRASTGFRTQTELISEITAANSGRDDAERLRNYLLEYYAQGGRFVLLVGDETHLPVRYLSHFGRNTAPDPKDLLLGDLYFADIEGDWDSDGDNIWGEPFHDSPSPTAELLVGRLPVSTVAEIDSYITKLVAYETNPGGGDFGYLTNTVFFSSDQMRDFSQGGQHGRIASAFPHSFTIDTTLGVEAERGDDLFPSNVPASELDRKLNYGIANVLAHGRPDGFVVRSAGTNGMPKSILLTEEEKGAHGSFDSVHYPDKAGFYYSLACDNGGFDLDSPPFEFSGETMVQQLIGSPGGAVGMVAYTRWGWVSSSHLLHKSFFDSLFAHPTEPAILAMYRSHLAYPHYRDLIYGQNFYGDPALRIHTSTPVKSIVQAQLEGNSLLVKAFGDSGPLINAYIHLSCEGKLLSSYSIGSEAVLIEDYLDPNKEYLITAVADHATISQVKFSQCIVTDVEDDNSGLPTSIALHQNYPNPFNPATRIDFALPSRTFVEISVYNILGQRVTTLANELMPAGTHSVIWQSKGSPSGMYFYEMVTENFRSTKKMLYLK